MKCAHTGYGDLSATMTAFSGAKFNAAERRARGLRLYYASWSLKEREAISYGAIVPFHRPNKETNRSVSTGAL
jgi:hypothetical protein